MSEEVPLSCEHRPTMFGAVRDKNVTFCIDTSGSMYLALDAVKEDLIESLSQKASSYPSGMFNLIEFNSEVTQWADKMVQCAPETVNVAKTWIKDLGPKTGTNTQGALLAALSDPNCHAVYIVTDGFPDQQPEDILDHVGYAGQGRPIHCIYVVTNKPESAATEFLEDLANESYGSFHVVTLTNHGCVDKITPVLAMDSSQKRVLRTVSGTIHPCSKACSVSTTLLTDPADSLVSPLYGYPYWYSHLNPYWCMSRYYPQMWSRYRPARGWLKAQEEMMEGFTNLGLSPSAGALLVGKRVLARNTHDGLFYLGSVQSQILEDKFLVGFGPSKHGRFQDTVYQETWIYDIISYEDAKRHAIVRGDKVLATCEPEGEKFCPGTVITGQERRQSEDPTEDKNITVLFSNGKTETVSQGTAVWIPVALFERLDLELKMPADVRQSLEERVNYPLASLPGYPTSGPVAHPRVFRPPPFVDPSFDGVALNTGLHTYPDYLPIYPIFYKRREEEHVKSAVKSEDVNSTIPGTNLTQGELRRKVNSQLEEHLGRSEAVNDKELRRLDDRRRKLLDMKEEIIAMKEEEIRRKRAEEELDNLNEEILKLESELKDAKEVSVHKEVREKEILCDDLKDKDQTKREMLQEEIRKREKELEILEREEKVGQEKAEREEQAQRQRERELRLKELERQRDRLRYNTGTDAKREAWIAEREAAIERRERELARQMEQERLLQRNRQVDNGLRKSVSFKDQTDLYDRGYDSGHGSSPEFWDREEYPETAHLPEYRHASKFASKGKKPRQKQGWKYWGNDPSPEIGPKTTSISRGPSAFRETMLKPPLEAKDRSERIQTSLPLNRPASYQYVDKPAARGYMSNGSPVRYEFIERPATAQYDRPSAAVYHVYEKPLTYSHVERPSTAMAVARPTAPQYDRRASSMWNEKTHPYPIEWTSPTFKYVDTFAKARRDNSVGHLLKTVPKPPNHPRPTTAMSFPDSEMGVVMGVRDRSFPTKEELNLQHRRTRVRERQTEFTIRVKEKESAQDCMELSKRQSVAARIGRENAREAENLQAIQRTMQAKQQINQELRSRLAENRVDSHERDQNRIAAKRAIKEQRQWAQAEKAQEQADKFNRAQEAKVQRSQLRWDRVNDRLNEQDQAAAFREQRCRQAKVNRIQHFRNIEESAQKSKELYASVTNQHLALYRSQVLP